MKFVRGIAQVALITVFWMIGNAAAERLHLPIPGSIVGLILLFLLLKLKVVKIQWVDQGAGWLLAELLLFFIPPAVGVIQYEDILSSHGIQIMAVIALSTLVVMACTGLSAEYLSKNRREKRHGLIVKNR